jgi:branched-chain amino acid transport system permease protein
MKILWGTQQLSVSRPAALNGSLQISSITLPHYNLFILVLGPMITLALWWIMHRTRAGRLVRAAAQDREMLGALGINVDLVRTATFAAGSFLAGLGGALVTPVRSIVPGMDVEIIVQLFTVVVIGGLGSLWGTLLGAIIYGQVLAFGILIFPRFSIFAAFALMAVVLVARPWGLLGRRPAVR